LRAWIRLALGDAAGARSDTERAVELARAFDLQAQAAAYCIRAAVVLAAGSRDEADVLATELAARGPEIVAGLCAPFPSLSDVAWVFRDLGRASELREAILELNPIKSPWNDAARSIVDGELVRAAEIIDGIGHIAAAAYARLRAAEAFAAVGQDGEAAEQRAQAEAFYEKVRAVGFLDRVRIGRTPAARRASLQP